MALFIINKKLWVYFGNLWPFLSAEKGGADLGITSVVLVKLFPPTTLLPLNFFFSPSTSLLLTYPSPLSVPRIENKFVFYRATYLCICTHLSQAIYLPTYVSIHTYLKLSTYLRVCTYLSQAIYLPTYVSVPTYLKLSTSYLSALNSYLYAIAKGVLSTFCQSDSIIFTKMITPNRKTILCTNVMH